MWVIVTMAVLKEVFHKKCIRIGTKWVSVSNGGAGREDPDADFLKFKKVYSKRKNRRAWTKGAAEPDLKNTWLMIKQDCE